MSILHQLNDEIIEKLKVRFVPPSPDVGRYINVDEEFTIKFFVTNDSGQYPQITFSNVALEIVAIPLFAEIINGDTLYSKRVKLGTVDYNDRKEVEVKFKAKMNLPPSDAVESVASWRIAGDVLLRCKDLNNPSIYAQIYRRT